jgi:hypothetical protein
MNAHALSLGLSHSHLVFVVAPLSSYIYIYVCVCVCVLSALFSFLFCSILFFAPQELNIRELTTSTDLSKLTRTMVPTNEKALGPKLRGDRRKVYEVMKTLSEEQLDAFEADGKLKILGYDILNTEATVGDNDCVPLG